MTQPTLTRYALNSAIGVLLPLGVLTGLEIARRLRNGEIYTAVVTGIACTAACIGLVAVDLLREASIRNGWPLGQKPLEDYSDSTLVHIGKNLVFVVLQLAALALPFAGLIAATGEPWPQKLEMRGTWFLVIVLLGLFPAFVWLRMAYARRRRYAQTRQAGTLTK